MVIIDGNNGLKISRKKTKAKATHRSRICHHVEKQIEAQRRLRQPKKFQKLKTTNAVHEHVCVLGGFRCVCLFVPSLSWQMFGFSCNIAIAEVSYIKHNRSL